MIARTVQIERGGYFTAIRLCDFTREEWPPFDPGGPPRRISTHREIAHVVGESENMRGLVQVFRELVPLHVIGHSHFMLYNGEIWCGNGSVNCAFHVSVDSPALLRRSLDLMVEHLASVTPMRRAPRPWDIAAMPARARAHAIGGGWWTKMPDGWWKANGGDRFPTPGADVAWMEVPAGAP